MTKCYNVLATLYNNQDDTYFEDANLIQEYTTDRSLIRQISLDDIIHNPMHCVQLSTGNFAVSGYAAGQCRLCIVDTSYSCTMDFEDHIFSHTAVHVI